MKKKSFVLSWGRKMFFGLGWLITSLVALSYLQAMIIPQGIEAWGFYFANLIGHIGIILCGVYFLLFCPVMILFPSYYGARLWSIFLLFCLNALIFLDSYIFIQYRFHLNSFVIKILNDPEVLKLIDLSPVKLGLIGMSAFILTILFWLRGDKLWRTMQARFSNPIKNWYLVLIGLCFLGAQGVQINSRAQGEETIPEIAKLFPLSFPLYSVERSHVDSSHSFGYKDFYYPSKINCSLKEPKNILLITLGEWSYENFSEEQTPNISHYASHGTTFKNHYSGGLNKSDGYFSLLYSLSPNYASSVLNQKIEPAFMTKLKESNFDFSFYKSGASTPAAEYFPKEKEIESDYLESTLADRKERDLVGSSFTQVFLDKGSLADKDNHVRVILEAFYHADLTNNTIVVITGAYSTSGRTPLIVIWPGKKASSVEKNTAHYDVLPTIMQEDWKCKTTMSKYSFAQNLFSAEERSSLVRGNYEHLELISFSNQTKTIIEPPFGLTVSNLLSGEAIYRTDNKFILESLKETATFYKR